MLCSQSVTEQLLVIIIWPLSSVLFSLNLHGDAHTLAVNSPDSTGSKKESNCWLDQSRPRSYHVSFGTLRAINTSKTLKRANQNYQANILLAPSRGERRLMHTGAPGGPGGPRGPNKPLGPCEQSKVFYSPNKPLVNEGSTLRLWETCLSWNFRKPLKSLTLSPGNPLGPISPSSPWGKRNDAFTTGLLEPLCI